MKYELKQHATKLVIMPSERGYGDYEELKAEIIQRDRKFVIDTIAVWVHGNEVDVDGGLTRVIESKNIDELISLPSETVRIMQAEHHERVEQYAAEQKEKYASMIGDAAWTGNWSGIPIQVKQQALAGIVISTTPFVSNRNIEQELGVVGAECVYGMNLFKDIFAAIGDVVGGRSRTAERVFKDARTAAIDDLRVEALKLGADAVVGMHIQYSELTGGGKNGMLLAIATGTAVKLSQ